MLSSIKNRFFRYWVDNETAKKVDSRVQKGLFLFASANSCMNPLVYGFYNIRRKRERKMVTKRK